MRSKFPEMGKPEKDKSLLSRQESAFTAKHQNPKLDKKELYYFDKMYYDRNRFIFRDEAGCEKCVKRRFY